MKKINTNFYKTLMGNFATGVTIVSINHNNNYIGKTVNSFSSLSLSPPLVLFSLDRNASSLDKFKKSKFIGINFLSSKQKTLSDSFANKNNAPALVLKTSGASFSIMDKEHCKNINGLFLPNNNKNNKIGNCVMYICKNVNDNDENIKISSVYFI